MRQRVTVVLVARNGGETLQRTLDGLRAQTRQPDSVLAIDVASRDASESMLASAGPTQLVSLPARVPPVFGAAIAHALRGSESEDPDAEWLWILPHTCAPDPRALEHLLAAVEIAPSVAIAGPKVMDWDRKDVIAGFGQSMTQLGASVALVEHELDQAQHDISEDVLGVAATGMLVRRSVFESLGGFDPKLPGIDVGLDLCVRARLAGHRVIVVPRARVATTGGPEHFDRPDVSVARRTRLARTAQLHRRLVYAPALAVPFHWLSLLPLAILRSFWHLLAKHPGSIPGEFAAAVAAAVDGGVFGARRNLARSKRLGWAAIAPLRLTAAEARERRGQAREVFAADRVAEEPRISYLGGGGLWVAVFSAIVGVVMFGPLLGARAVTGGGLLPLSATIGELWGNVGTGWRAIGAGFEGPADPFTAVLAVLGSFTFWAPSLSIIVLHILALPLAATTAWFAARRLTPSRWVPIVASVLWTVAPPFIASLMSGHLGAVIAHILLPWLVLAALKGARSVSSAALATLLFAVVSASSPVLVPALVLAWVAWMVANPRSVGRLIGIPLLALVFFAPLVLEQLRRGTPLALLADPGAPAAAGATSGWHLALVSAGEGLNGWTSVADAFGLPGTSAHIIVAVLLAPLGALAILSLMFPGLRRSVPALALALLGFITAVAGSRIALSAFGDEAVPVWPGSGLTLFWLGLVGAAVVALEGISAADRRTRVAALSGSLAAVTVFALSMPLLLALHLGDAALRPTDGRRVPAVVDAEARTSPDIGTVVLNPTSDGALVATLQRGMGATLDAQSTLDATARTTSDDEETLARLVGNLASRGDYEPADDLAELYVGFIVLADASDGVTDDVELEAGTTRAANAVAQRTADSLDSSAVVTPVGETALGLLWRIAEPPSDGLDERIGNTDTLEGRIILAVQAGLAIIVLLLAVPTQRRHKPRVQRLGDGPASTFEEETDD